MHDPMTQAFQIPYPWRKYGKKGRDERRPWYRHPRWHFWHWQLQIHPVQTFKRWAFTRCASCGGRFPWGTSGWTNSWSGDGPQWFKSERDLHHNDCRNPRSSQDPTAAQGGTPSETTLNQAH
jgi:hypothetical protein